VSAETPFFIDYAYDREYATYESRFAAYVARNAEELRSAIEWSTSAWAREVWRVATPPIMSPGFIRCPVDEIVSWRWDTDDDGVPHVSVDIAATPLAADRFRHLRYAGWRKEWNEIVPPDLKGGGCALLPIVRTVKALEVERLERQVPQEDAPLFDYAVATCEELVSQINDAVEPVLAEMYALRGPHRA
jgi:hypothetical protein